MYNSTNRGSEGLEDQNQITVNGDKDCGPVSSMVTVERVATARLPTQIGDFTIIGYRSLVSDEEFRELAGG